MPGAGTRSPAHGKGHEVKGPDRQRRVGPYGSLAVSACASAPKQSLPALLHYAFRLLF